MKIRIIFLCISCLIFLSCEKLLDVKSDKSLSTINSLDDLEELLDTYILGYSRAPSGTEVFSDNYYITSTDWATLSSDYRSYYLWETPNNSTIGEWSLPYANIYKCNLVLEEIKGRSWKGEENRAEIIKGRALFLRASYFYSLSQLFSKAYNKITSDNDLGIVLKLSTDLKEVVKRSSVEQTYQQIINDFKKAVMLLPESESIKTRPTRSAAFGALARTYLAMSEYNNALMYADSCLHIYSTLMDYNNLDTNSTTPISRFNDEVIFHSTSSSVAPLSPRVCKIDSLLIQTYDSNDLRKPIFYIKNADNSFGFKGDYDGSPNNANGHCFTGIATDEQYLILAECYVRAGKVDEALRAINSLLITRWKKNTFAPYVENDPAEVLKIILNERRKELVFRTLRLTDLKRLNLTEKKVTIYRMVNGETYTLLPNSDAYVAKIPQDVINMSGIPQNP